MKSALLFFITLNCLSTYAEDTPFQQMLERDLQVNSRERTVTIEGVNYQKIEIENDTFYVVFKGRQGEIPHLLCSRPEGFKSEHLVEGSLKIARRKSVFVSILKESCVTKNGQDKTTVPLDPLIGIYLPETSKDKIKNKKVGINPLAPGAVNFSGEF